MGYRRFLRQWSNIGQPELYIGIRGDKKDDEGFPMAAIGAANEFGTRSADGSVHIPERSFLRSTIAEKSGSYFKFIAKGVGQIADGSTTMKEVLSLVGTKAVGDVQKKIVDLRDPPNAPRTIAQKKGENNPLIDTGRLRQSIDFVIRKRGEGL